VCSCVVEQRFEAWKNYPSATWKFDAFSGEEEISTKSIASRLFENDILLTHYKENSAIFSTRFANSQLNF